MAKSMSFMFLGCHRYSCSWNVRLSIFSLCCSGFLLPSLFLFVLILSRHFMRLYFPLIFLLPSPRSPLSVHVTFLSLFSPPLYARPPLSLCVFRFYLLFFPSYFHSLLFLPIYLNSILKTLHLTFYELLYVDGYLM